MGYDRIALCQTFRDRAVEQGLKGRARDRAALEFIIGASAMALQVFGEKSAEFQSLGTLSFFVSLRGFELVNEIAGKDA